MIPITQLGRIVKDIELTTTEKDGEKNVVLNNSLAIRINKDNTMFIEFSAWGKVAESIAEYYNKGCEILVTGELRNKVRKFGDKEITTVFLLVKNYDFTYGNKKEE